MCLASQDTSVLGGVSCRARSLQTVPSDKIPELCHVSPSSGLDSTILYERNLDSAQPKQSPKLLNQRHMSVHSFQALLPYCFNRPQASYLELDHHINWHVDKYSCNHTTSTNTQPKGINGIPTQSFQLSLHLSECHSSRAELHSKVRHEHL